MHNCFINVFAQRTKLFMKTSIHIRTYTPTDRHTYINMFPEKCMQAQCKTQYIHTYIHTYIPAHIHTYTYTHHLK